MDRHILRDAQNGPENGGTCPPRTLFCYQGRSTYGDAKFNWASVAVGSCPKVLRQTHTSKKGGPCH
eukprot:5850224-Ditylum_brightwellii.AAC.1